MSIMEQNKDLTLAYCLENNINLAVRTTGLNKQIADATGLTFIQAKTALKLVRKDLGFNTKEVEEKKYKTIEQCFLDTNLNPHSRMSHGTLPPIAEKLQLPLRDIRAALNRFRKKTKSRVRAIETSKPAESGIVNPFVPMLRDLGITRANANAEKIGCKLIIECLFKIPWGGAGMIFGTATPSCAPTVEGNNNMLLSDNQKVAHALEFTTAVLPVIVIGNGVNAEKAETKAMLWKTDNSTSDYDIKVDIVSRESLMFHGMKLAEQHPFAKLVIMTSGSWTSCDESVRKYRLDSNFKAPCEFLSARYPNLHIIAMVTGGLAGSYYYRVEYLHNGKSETIVYNKDE